LKNIHHAGMLDGEAQRISIKMIVAAVKIGVDSGEIKRCETGSAIACCCLLL
jgi:hypothetical protein